MKDNDYRNIGCLYESLAIKEQPKGEVEGDKDHVIYIDIGEDVWEIDLKSDDHKEDCNNLLDKIKKFLIHYKNDVDINPAFLEGLLNSEKLHKYLKKFNTHPQEFLNKL